MSEPDQNGLRRQLDFVDLTALYVGIILGSGIFVAPAAIVAAAPGMAGGAGLWLLGGVVTACGAFVYAEAGTRLPHTGGFYVFYREAFGPPVAFVGGWAALLVTYPSSLAAIAVVCAQYFGRVFPATAEHDTWVAAGAIVIAGSLNIVGLRTGPNAQRVLTSLKVALLLLLCAVALTGGEAPPAAAAVSNGAPELTFSAVVLAATVLMWTYDGWSNIALVSGEVEDPRRDLARAVIVGTIVLVVVYVVVQVAVVSLLSPAQAAGSTAVFSEAVAAALGDGSGRWVAVLVVISTFGALAASLLTGARIGYAMALDRLLPRVFCSVHPRWGTPAAAIGVLTVACLVYAFSGTFGELLSFFSFSVWIFYGLVTVSLLVFRARKVGEERAWRAPGGILAPAVVLLSAAGMCAGVMIDTPVRSLIGLAAILAAIPAYFLWRHFEPFGGDA